MPYHEVAAGPATDLKDLALPTRAALKELAAPHSDGGGFALDKYSPATVQSLDQPTLEVILGVR